MAVCKSIVGLSNRHLPSAVFSPAHATTSCSHTVRSSTVLRAFNRRGQKEASNVQICLWSHLGCLLEQHLIDQKHWVLQVCQGPDWQAHPVCVQNDAQSDAGARMLPWTPASTVACCHAQLCRDRQRHPGSKADPASCSDAYLTSSCFTWSLQQFAPAHAPVESAPAGDSCGKDSQTGPPAGPAQFVR